jgi:hypothetical protein
MQAACGGASVAVLLCQPSCCHVRCSGGIIPVSESCACFGIRELMCLPQNCLRTRRSYDVIASGEAESV